MVEGTEERCRENKESYKWVINKYLFKMTHNPGVSPNNPSILTISIRLDL